MKTGFHFLIQTLILLQIKISQSQNQNQNETLANQARSKLKYLETTKQIKREPIPTYGDENLIINEKSYDFIIVGGGTSGSLLANRLSNPVTGWTVLLLEAGSTPDTITEIPSWSNLNQFGKNNWKYLAEKEPTIGKGLETGKVKITLGKGLGGSSLLSHAIYSRGRPEDYDSWNVEGWRFKDLLEYFKKLEKCRLDKCFGEFRGFNGDIGIENVKFKSEIAQKFVESCLNAGYKFNEDYNIPIEKLNEELIKENIKLKDTKINNEIKEENKENKEEIKNDLKEISYLQGFLLNGLKLTSEKLFLRPSMNRKSLTIYKNAHVTKILFNKGNKATGVKFLNKHKIHSVYARKEIIITAGAINTPKILMLSGIGPENHLKALNIPVLKDLPVGENLNDHVNFWGLLFVTKEGTRSNEIINENLIKQLYLNQTGILNILGNGAEVIIHQNEIEMLLLRNHFPSNNKILKDNLGISDQIYEKYESIKKRKVYTLLITLLKPKSRGKIKLRSKNPTDSPKINFKYFSERNDLKLMIEGIRKGRELLLTSPLNEFGKPYDIPFQPCSKYKFDSDNYWKCSIEHLSTGSHDYSSSCSIGKVVDAKLKVKGVERLRIGDVSVLPGLISGHNEALAYVIGERLSNFIKKQYLKDEL